MLHTTSPWLFELKKTRKPYKVEKPFDKNDIVIVGAGIAGVVSAYYILHNTKKNVLLLEKNFIASGATGYNAGQIVTYFEKPTKEIIEEYGHGLVLDGQEEIYRAWDLLEEIRKTVNLQTPVYIFEGLSGCVTLKSVQEHLQNRFNRPTVSHQKEFCFVADDCPFLDKIPPQFKDLYTIVPRKVVLDLLETRNTNYCIAFTSRKGSMNSAMFCEEIVRYLLKKFPVRFKIGEKTNVQKVVLYKDHAELFIANYPTIKTNVVLLCTNGFKDLHIINKAGPTISTAYHESIRGKKGFMKAYTVQDKGKPTAVSYYDKNDAPYFYLTRRPSLFSHKKGYNLIAVGGPEYFIADRIVYNEDSQFTDDIRKRIDYFIRWTRINEFRKEYEHVFLWHGLMGYTRNGIRIIGPDKNNPILLYNLGCNGVGILPSIAGGKRIAQFLNKEIHKKSIFDPYI